MIQRVGSELKEVWQKFVDSFVGAAATALLVGVGALITGIYERIHMIDQIAAKQLVFESAVVKMVESQDRLKDADSKLGERMATFSGEHQAIQKEVLQIRTALDARRAR